MTAKQSGPLLPPTFYAIVESGVYRSDTPSREHFPFIRSLDLRTVLLLSPEKPLKELQAFFDANSITLIHLGLDHIVAGTRANASWKPVRDELIKEGVQHVLDAAKHPIMLMCSSGKHQTGALVACLRKLQNWSLTAAINEYRLFAGQKARHATELFIELFDTDLITPPLSLPAWFLSEQEQRERSGNLDEEDEGEGADEGTPTAPEEDGTAPPSKAWFVPLSLMQTP